MSRRTTADDKADWDVDETKILTEFQKRKLQRSCEHWKQKSMRAGGHSSWVKDWFVVVLGLETGLRVQEMADLQIRDLHVNDGHRSVRVKNGKGGRPRTVYVRQVFVDMALEFLEWKRVQGDRIDSDTCVFSCRGKQMSTRALQKSYDRSRKRAGISQPKGVGIHSLRHTFATFLLAGTRNLRFVQRQLGHASIKTTEIYLHVLDGMGLIEKLYAK